MDEQPGWPPGRRGVVRIAVVHKIFRYHSGMRPEANGVPLTKRRGDDPADAGMKMGLGVLQALRAKVEKIIFAVHAVIAVAGLCQSLVCGLSVMKQMFIE